MRAHTRRRRLWARIAAGVVALLVLLVVVTMVVVAGGIWLWPSGPQTAPAGS